MVGITLVLLAGVVSTPKLAVLPAQMLVKVDKQVQTMVDDYVLTAAQAGGLYEVIGQSDLDAVLGFEKQKELMGCDQMSCFAELGGALGVDKLLSVRIAKIKERWNCSLSLIEVKSGTPKVEARVTEKVAGDEDALTDALPLIVAKLLGTEVKPVSKVGEPAAAVALTTKPVESSELSLVFSARGTSDRGAFARVGVWVDGRPWQEFETSGEMKEYRASIPASACTVSLMLVNDSCERCKGQNTGSDRNLEFGTIRLGDRMYAAGSRGLFRKDCTSYQEGPGMLAVNCQQGHLTLPVNPVAKKSTVSVRARGEPNGGVYPNMQIFVNGRLQKAVSAGAGWGDYKVDLDEKACWVQVAFDNDAFSATDGDRNLEVDAVSIDGALIDTLKGDTYVQDCFSTDWYPWRNGIPSEKKLMCGEGGFFYRAAR